MSKVLATIFGPQFVRVANSARRSRYQALKFCAAHEAHLRRHGVEAPPDHFGRNDLLVCANPRLYRVVLGQHCGLHILFALECSDPDLS
jgi:hypothetical protein